MSETSSLSELANFAGRSGLSAADPLVRRRAASSVASTFKPKQHHSVTELLGVVLALSARTRRMVLPRVDIDVDVFAPGGTRAVRLILPKT